MTATHDTRNADSAAAHHVLVRIGGSQQHFDCGTGQTLLDAALAAGVTVPFSCREGHCGTCMVILAEGEVTNAPGGTLSKRDRLKGYVLACRATPVSATLRLDYDR